MESIILINALQLTAYLSGLAVLVIAAGGLLGGVLRVATQLEDPAIAFLSRFGAFLLLVLLGSQFFLRELSTFALRIWGGSDVYL